MRRPALVITAALAIAVSTFAGESSGGATPTHVRRLGAVSPYMHVCPPPNQLQFCVGASTFYPYGATVYQSTSQAGIGNPAGAIALAQSQHLNTIRLVNFLNHDGDPRTAPFDPTAWAQADAFIADAETAGIRILLDLSDYRAELWNNCTDPYTASWAKYLAFVARRTNTVDGVAYRSDPGVVMVTFAGEPQPPGTYTFTDAAGAPCTLTYTTAQLTGFYARVETRWHQLDRHHLTAAGGLSNVDLANNGIDWQSIFGNRHNSACAWKTYGGMLSWVAGTGAPYCRGTLGKPWFNDEWGYLQSMGDGARASAFSTQFQANQLEGAAGNFFWNANYLVTPTTYDVNPQTPLTQAAVVANAP